ncbi:MAG: hypothetical protein WCD18_10800, partial [Thermosynechococcaceae cyanobacterium]
MFPDATQFRLEQNDIQAWILDAAVNLESCDGIDLETQAQQSKLLQEFVLGDRRLQSAFVPAKLL